MKINKKRVQQLEEMNINASTSKIIINSFDTFYNTEQVIYTKASINEFNEFREKYKLNDLGGFYFENEINERLKKKYVKNNNKEIFIPFDEYKEFCVNVLNEVEK